MSLLIFNFHGIGPVPKEIIEEERACWLDQDHFETVLDLARGQSHVHLTFDDGNVSDYLWLTNGWQLTTGGGLRKEIQTSSTTNSVRTVVQEIRSSSNTVVSTSTRKYQSFGGRDKLIEQSFGTGATAQTNTYTYYDDGSPKQVIRANGSWEWTEYDGQARPTSVPLVPSSGSTSFAVSAIISVSHSSIGGRSVLRMM